MRIARRRPPGPVSGCSIKQLPSRAAAQAALKAANAQRSGIFAYLCLC